MELNVEALKKIAQTNDTSKSIFEELMTRQRSRAQINLRKFRYDMLRKGMKVEEENFIETFRKLQEMGVGSVISGRHGKATRFVWNYKLKSVATAAGGKEIKIQPKTTKTPLKTVPKADQTKPLNVTTHDSMIAITFNVPYDTRIDDLSALFSLVKTLDKK